MSATATSNHPVQNDEDAIDLRQLWSNTMRGLPRTIGLAFLGLALGATAYFVAGTFQSMTTESRVVFSFEGFERGEYPDKSKFQPDDLRAPEVISEALKRRGLAGQNEMQSKIRAALNVEGIIPANVVKERDRLRAAGQTLRPYIPDEYSVTLVLSRDFPLNSRERELLLNDVVSVYLEQFQRTYVNAPLDFGSAFESLDAADFFDYELVLSRENANISTYLNEMADRAKSFRSPRTNLSFSDLVKQNQLFTQIRLNESLGLIRQFGLSRDRTMAMLKMDYHLRTLTDREASAIEEESHIRNLLTQAQDRTQNYVLGIRSQVQQKSESPVIDQGLVDSLLANDAYNFLVRQVLDAGLRTRRIQAEKAVLLERRTNMEKFLSASRSDQAEVIKQFEKSLGELKEHYHKLIQAIRTTHEDYQRQQFADAARISMQPRTQGFYRPLAMAAISGALVGAALGIGLSLLGIGIPERREPTPST